MADVSMDMKVSMGSADALSVESTAAELPANLFEARMLEGAGPGAAEHAVLRTSMLPPFPKGCEVALFGMGCFWGAERRLWTQPGMHTTAVGYAGGIHLNPDYRLVCSGSTGHAEVVMVVFRPAELRFLDLLRVFFEAHDPTQGMRQGNDVGTQYRSVIYTTTPAQTELARVAHRRYDEALRANGFPAVTTEIRERITFYYAEPYHQQYLAKNPGGYCGLRGTGVSCNL